MALFNNFFYNRLLRKYTVAFGNLFSKIHVVNYTDDTHTTEHSRQKVRLTYAPKEKFIQRLSRIEDFEDEGDRAAVILPAMSFEITGMGYNPQWKQATLRKTQLKETDPITKKSFTYAPVPYDIFFALNIYTATQDEALQIIEQILPFFTPSFSLSIKTLKDQGVADDVHVNLVGTNLDDTFDGAFDERRRIIWTLDFNMHALFYGPVREKETITDVFARIIEQGSGTRISDIEFIAEDPGDATSLDDYTIEEFFTDGAQESTADELVITQGLSYRFKIGLFENDGTAFDLTDQKVVAELQNLSENKVADFEVSIVDPRPEGKVVLSLGAEVTDNLALGSYTYVITATDTTDDTTTQFTDDATVVAP